MVVGSWSQEMGPQFSLSQTVLSKAGLYISSLNVTCADTVNTICLTIINACYYQY